jgi:hypothetical protein
VIKLNENKQQPHNRSKSNLEQPRNNVKQGKLSTIPRDGDHSRIWRRIWRRGPGRLERDIIDNMKGYLHYLRFPTYGFMENSVAELS